MDGEITRSLRNYYNKNPTAFTAFAYAVFALGYNHAVDVAEGVAAPVRETDFEEFIRDFFKEAQNE